MSQVPSIVMYVKPVYVGVFVYSVSRQYLYDFLFSLGVCVLLSILGCPAFFLHCSIYLGIWSLPCRVFFCVLRFCRCIILSLSGIRELCLLVNEFFYSYSH